MAHEMLNDIKAVIFDLDGTLLNTLLDLASSVNYAMRECGFNERTTDEIRRFIGNGVAVLIQRSVPDGISEEEYKKALDIFKTHYKENSRNNTAPYDGICDHLKKTDIILQSYPIKSILRSRI